MPAAHAIICSSLIHLTFKTYFKTQSLLIKWGIKVRSSSHSEVKPATVVQAELGLLEVYNWFTTAREDCLKI